MKAKATVHITNHSVHLNGKNTCEDCFIRGKLSPKLLYKAIGLDYPKFYKMDRMSKLGFLAVELLKTVTDLSGYGDDGIALLFQNSYASLDTDIVHQDHINDETRGASPAVFVYTLPNIVMGEIAIYNKWYGENLFEVEQAFNPEKWINLADILLSTGKAKAVIGGWLDVFGNHIDIRFFLVDGDSSPGNYPIN